MEFVRDVLSWNYQTVKSFLGFISKWNNKFLTCGVSGLRLWYKGKSSYLSQSEKAEVIAWLNNKEIWDIAELAIHISRGDNKATKHSGARIKHEALVENWVVCGVWDSSDSRLNPTNSRKIDPNREHAIPSKKCYNALLNVRFQWDDKYTHQQEEAVKKHLVKWPEYKR